MSDKPKKNYIRYTPEQLAAVPSPAEKEQAAEGRAVAGVLLRSSLIGAAAGAILGPVVGAKPVEGAVVGGALGVAHGATQQAKKQ